MLGRSNFILRVGVLLVFSVLLMTGSVVAQNEYKFAYTYQVQEGQINFGIVNPNTQTVEVLTLPVTATEYLAQVAGNPTSDWIALALRSGRNQVVRLVNVNTLTVQNIAPDVYPSQRAENILASQQDFVWSPNGRYLAFNVWTRPDIRTSNDTMLYSFETNSSMNLTPDPADSTRLAWSTDSQKLALVSVNCSQSCAASLDIYNAVTQSRMTSFSLTPQVPGAESSTLAGVCELAWSPDNRYISFMANCASSDTGAYKEIYVLEVATGQINRITNYTYQQDIAAQNGFLYAEYRTIWLDTNQLLISAIYGLVDVRQAETLIYTPNVGQINLVSTEFIQNWAENPISHSLAYQSFGRTTQTYDYVIHPETIQMTTPEIGLEQALSDSSQEGIITSSGCLLDWSPDGTILAYALPSISDNCFSRPERFGFIGTDGQELMLSESVISGNGLLIPVGWIAR